MEIVWKFPWFPMASHGRGSETGSAHQKTVGHDVIPGGAGSLFSVKLSNFIDGLFH